MVNAKTVKKTKQSRRIHKKILILSAILIVGIIILVCHLAMRHKTSLSVHSSGSNKTNAAISMSGLQKDPCLNNSGMTCISAPSINLYPADNEYTPATTLNPSFAYGAATEGAQREIGGKIVSISGNTIRIMTTNKKLYSVAFPIDAITNFNNNVAPKYNSSNNFKVGIGSTLYITYFDPAYFSSTVGSTTIAADQLQYSSVIIRPANPASPPDLL